MDAKLVQMTAPDSGSFAANFYTVTDSEQARLLTEPVSKEFFKPFLACERSASEAAAVMQLRCSLNTMLYRVKTLLRAGLLEVVREEPRKGRAVKIYRSVHDAYFVPFTMTPYATLEERLEVQSEPIFAGLIRAYADALRQDNRYGHHIFIGDGGGVWTSDLLPKLTPAGLPNIFTDVYIKLRDEDAHALGEGLRELLERALRLDKEAQDDPEVRAYLNMVALLPFSSS